VEKQALKILLIVMVVSFAIAAMLWDAEDNILQSFAVDVKETASLNGVQRVSVQTVSTRVEVGSTTGSDLEVHYVGEGQLLRGSVPELRVTRRGDAVNVELVATSSSVSFLSASVKLWVMVPMDYAGSVSVQSSSGSVVCRDLLSLSDLTVRSVSGRQTVTNVALNGRLQLDSSSGSVTVEDVSAQRIRVTTSSGRITLERPSVTADMQLQSSSGSVRLTMPAQSSFAVSAQSSSGSVNNSRGVPSTGVSERNRFVGQVGSGGPQITIQTASGGISLL